MVQAVDGKTLAAMLIHASASLDAEKQKINELNVFPVPDGDTGTNMSLTIGTAAAELRQKNPATVGQATALCASAMLRGARGNSGVILSLIFRGFSRAMKDKDTMDGIDLADAINAGVIAAYRAVMKPAEGTLLTVSRLAGDRAGRAAEENTAFEYVLASAIDRAREALADTIHQNPVLKKAGVVDAGGMGFVVVLQAMLDELQGIPAPQSGQEEAKPQEKADFGALAEEELTFTYDTVFIVRQHRGQALGGATGLGWRPSATAWSSERATRSSRSTSTPTTRAWPSPRPRSTAPWSWPRLRTCAPSGTSWPPASRPSPPTTWRP